VEIWFRPVSAVAVRWWRTNQTSNHNGFTGQWNGTTTVALTTGDNGGTGGANRRTHNFTVTAFTAGQLYHIVGICTGHNSMQLYIDGVEQTSKTINSTGTSMSTSTGAATVGWNNGYTSFTGADANFNDFAIYSNKTLTAAQILEHYNAGLIFLR
jgi:hypothetical protein